MAGLVLCGCLTQDPAPVSLRGEEFYGNRERDESADYHLARDYSERGATATASSKRKLLVRDIPTHSEPPASTKPKQASKSAAGKKCGFDMPISGGKAVPASNTSGGGGPYCNDGVAIFADGVAQVKAAGSGKVMYVGKGLRWYGSLVILEHDKYTISLYSYLHEVHVKVGDKVKKGQAIATIAKSSPSADSGYFFCFSIRHNGKSVNPIQYIKRCKNGAKS
ncbi:peptidoglycan DD-metalloendopeptidase family protein [Anaplasma capra]|uniref:murein hydrolase activator EnvC family protein n=1 Tax=Anaplasma capra TaxID=1562740 RepID=UPI0021D5E575|nr:peptidoglycan DD-metalloendopeptidase family protein [Anaplasma capra]MCU7611824.1 peptidoglycan DD-metalloendopeptidase family protein [Anaplasma capra]